MNIDVSDYLKAAFDEKYGEGNYIKTVNDEGNSVLLVNIKGIESLPFSGLATNIATYLFAKSMNSSINLWASLEVFISTSIG